MVTTEIHTFYIGDVIIWHLHHLQARSEGGVLGDLRPPQPSKKVRFLEVVKSWYGYVGIQEQDGAEKRLEARFYTPHF